MSIVKCIFLKGCVIVYKFISIIQEFEIEPISANIVAKDFSNPKKVQKGKSWPNIITWMNVTSVYEGRKLFKYELKKT